MAFASNLAANSRMGSFVAPIISRGRVFGEHEIELGDEMKLSNFEAFRPKMDSPLKRVAFWEKLPVSVMAIDESVQKLKKVLEHELKVTIKTTGDTLEINGLVHMTRTLSSRKFQLDLFFPHNFPCASPIALFSAKEKGVLKDAQDLQFPWGLTCFDPQALTDRIAPIIAEKTKEKAHDLS